MKSEDEILSHFKRMTEVEERDPILVSGTIFYATDQTGKKHKYCTTTLMPIILTPIRYLAFVKEANGQEYYFDAANGTHQRIFWFKPTKETKTLQKLYEDNYNVIMRIMGKYENPKTSKYGIILPNGFKEGLDNGKS